jgi:putative addiction module killer protein
MKLLEVREYQTDGGRKPFSEWLRKLRDPKGKRAVLARITRLQDGNWGDCKALGAGLFELRIHTGPGYRLYCGADGDTLVMLLCAGSKRTQSKDIENARRYWKDYQIRR